MTVILAAAQVDIQKESCRNTHIYMNSRAVLIALQNMTAKSKLFVECDNTLNCVTEKRTMELLWTLEYKEMMAINQLSNYSDTQIKKH